MVKKEDIQIILHSYANRNIERGTVEFDTLYELLLQHPKSEQKIGVGVDYFYVQNSKFNFRQFNFMIRKLDGSSEDFSYKKCFSPKAPSSIGINYIKIFRNIVKDQTDAFRAKAFSAVGVKDQFICSQTGLKFKKIFAHVDHVYPLTFHSIFEEFVKKHNINLSELELTPDKRTSEYREVVDESIKKLFSEHHLERAVLRIVYKTANLQAKKTKNYNKQKPEAVKKRLLKLYPQYHLLK